MRSPTRASHTSEDARTCFGFVVPRMQVRAVLLEKRRRRLAAREGGMVDTHRQERLVRRHAKRDRALEAAHKLSPRLLPRRADPDELRDRRIAIRRYLSARLQRMLDAQIRGHCPREEFATPWKEAVIRILRAESRLDRMYREAALILPERNGSPAATRSWSASRSRPVIASVARCSTWRRVFISMK